MYIIIKLFCFLYKIYIINIKSLSLIVVVRVCFINLLCVLLT